METAHFLSYRCPSDKDAFEEAAESLLNQKNNNWEWTLIPELVLKNTSASFREKLTSHPRVNFISELDFAEKFDFSKNWAYVFFDTNFKLEPNFVDQIEIHHKAWQFDLLYSDVEISGDGDLQNKIWRRPKRDLERLFNSDYLFGALVVSQKNIDQLSKDCKKYIWMVEQHASFAVAARNGNVHHVFEPLISASEEYLFEKTNNVDHDRLEIAANIAASQGRGVVRALGPTGNWALRRMAKEKKTISIVIPTRGDKKRIWGIETDLIENVIKSLFEKTSTEEFEVVVVHDVNDAYIEHASSLAQYGDRVKLVPFKKPFNFAEKCNIGALNSSAEVLVFLNDDIEVIDSWWLDHLVGYLESKTVGAVGPVLLLENGLVQSAGHANEPLPANYYSREPFGLKSFPEALDVPCEVSGLTAACIAVRRKIFDEVGGFCEDLPNNFNDVDFCMKIQETGRSLIWTPLAKLYHIETTTRDTKVTKEETEFMRDRWGRTFGVDLHRSRID
jgi:GT2 family glycosyltransferase